MPDDIIIDLTKITDARAALICARLQLRDGKRRLQKGLTARGIVALYDSVLFGMRYYLTEHERCASFLENTDPWDALNIFHALSRAGVFDDARRFHRLSLMAEQALWQGSFSWDGAAILEETEKILTQLGVIASQPNL